MIVGLAPVCGFPVSFVARRILPGVAISVLAGNLFYAWQARRLALRTGRADVTAIRLASTRRPSSLTCSSSWARLHADPRRDAGLAGGVFASFLSGVVQTALAFCSDWLRRNTPLAALLSPMAGLALAFLCLGFVFGVFQQAAIALLPMIVLFALYGSHLRLPLRLPPDSCSWAWCGVGGRSALAAHLYDSDACGAESGNHLPRAVSVVAILNQHSWWSYLSIILPLAALDTLGSLLILERRQGRRGRLRHHAVSPHKRSLHARCSLPGKSVSDNALLGSRLTQSQRCWRSLFGAERSCDIVALHHGNSARGASVCAARGSRASDRVVWAGDRRSGLRRGAAQPDGGRGYGAGSSDGAMGYGHCRYSG